MIRSSVSSPAIEPERGRDIEPVHIHIHPKLDRFTARIGNARRGDDLRHVDDIIANHQIDLDRRRDGFNLTIGRLGRIARLI